MSFKDYEMNKEDLAIIMDHEEKIRRLHENPMEAKLESTIQLLRDAIAE